MDRVNREEVEAALRTLERASERWDREKPVITPYVGQLLTKAKDMPEFKDRINALRDRAREGMEAYAWRQKGTLNGDRACE